jgi:RND family efflux transporter MFP subunit
MAIRLSLATLLTIGSVFVLSISTPSHAAQTELAIVAVTRGDGVATYRVEGVVESVRHADIAAQVPGRITQLPVKAGAKVAAGTVLALIDARAAVDQQAAARAQLDIAQREYERSRELFAKRYISKVTMDRAEAEYRVARAQANVSGTQNDFHRVAAPFAGVVSDVLVEVGDMAQPGKALLRFYDPRALRITAQVPEAIADNIATQLAAQVDIGDRAAVKVRSVQVMPTADARTHTREVRAELAAGVEAAPGAFAKLLLPLRGGDSASALTIPASSVLVRSEFRGVYVIKGKAVQLRQVRLGPQRGDRIEVLAGLREGEQIARDPVLALARTAKPAPTEKQGAVHE